MRLRSLCWRKKELVVIKRDALTYGWLLANKLFPAPPAYAPESLAHAQVVSSSPPDIPRNALRYAPSAANPVSYVLRGRTCAHPQRSVLFEVAVPHADIARQRLRRADARRERRRLEPDVAGKRRTPAADPALQAGHGVEAGHAAAH